jgi:hypothetical protein
VIDPENDHRRGTWAAVACIWIALALFAGDGVLRARPESIAA